MSNMIQLPSYLSSYQATAEACLSQGKVKDLEFSGSTYQVLVEDPSHHQDFWVFLQLEGKRQIKDAFCSCETSSEGEGCLHLAVAYLSLFGKYKSPLHQRFCRSLWNQICRLYCDRLGDDRSCMIQQANGFYICKSAHEKTIFIIRAKTEEGKEKLDRLLNQAARETEETSLKFSNRSHEEILLWREGRPSPQLRYDLSFWSDIAKWLMLLQENE
jgi:hypothetical protein